LIKVKVQARGAARQWPTQAADATGMKVELLVCAGSGPCERAERVWRAVAADGGFTLEVIDLRGPAGAVIEARLNLTAIPAVVIDGRLAAVGVQSAAEARALLNALSRE
jgi:hypothetical protein